MLINRKSVCHGRRWMAIAGTLLLSVGAPLLRAQPSCTTAKLENGGTVSLETKVAWKPAACKLVTQAYQQGRLVGEHGKQAGIGSHQITVGQLTEGRPGKTELKIWVPGASTPSDAVWVMVQGGK